MRILHTSDWHLGRSFHGVGMLPAQAEFIDRLVETVRERRVDAVLIAGDVYDRALPGVDTVRLLDSALERITAAGAVVVLSSGNHDSAARLGFGSALFERAGVHLRTRYADIARPVILPAAGMPVAVYGIPYLEPRLAAAELEVQEPSHFTVTAAAVARIRADLLAREQAGAPVAAVVMAHTFASGGISSDSERDLAVGGLGAVPLDLFDGFAYTALGHLHGRQQLREDARYSGSPLPYSFSEARQDKGGWLLEFDDGVPVSVEAVTWPARRRLAVLRGRLADLLADPALADAETAYCQVTLTDRERPAKAMDQVRTRFPDTLVLAFEPEGGAAGPARTYSQRLAGATDDLDICCGFLEHVRSRSAAQEEKDLFIEVLDRVREAEAAK
ncbi:exonuclease SbcCD subunit D [Arthrobacter sp. zg-Y411]|uniref:exonuclease SbcCD subunit D n=1 Tax=Arthrobacter zhangbolii TaxID=2886936 RepID=UPI001D15263B|nr:exonuclease SbcCD subunit D [Arthrobacter zhangbolii]MCC3294686.1 exonuclease SbcCD subunit D [Arthrobacter zhangbolii]